MTVGKGGSDVQYINIKEDDVGMACEDAKERSAFKVSTGNPQGKISVGRPSYRWENSIKL
jgi:hypothetical protein